MRLAGSRGAFRNGYYLNLIFFSIVFDLAPKRETGGPKGRLFFLSALFNTTVLLFFSFFSVPPDTGYTIPKKLNQLFFKGKR